MYIYDPGETASMYCSTTTPVLSDTKKKKKKKPERTKGDIDILTQAAGS
jgi:hypothetical protein